MTLSRLGLQEESQCRIFDEEFLGVLKLQDRKPHLK
jgi:hypothetical protein